MHYIFQVKKKKNFMQRYKKLLDTHYPRSLISIYTVGILNLRIITLSLNLSYS